MIRRVGLLSGMILACDAHTPSSVVDEDVSRANLACTRAKDRRLEALVRFESLTTCLRESPNIDRAPTIRSFVEGVEATEGFPILGVGRAIFVYVRSADDGTWDPPFNPRLRREPFELVAWRENQQITRTDLKPLGQGVFATEIDLEDPADVRYKLMAHTSSSEEVWFSDPLSRRFGFDGFGRYSLVRGGPSNGHFQWLRNVDSSRFDRPVFLWLPPGYDQSEDHYPVLYLQDGQNVFTPEFPNAAPFGTWSVHEALEAEMDQGTVRPGILVGIPNDENRMDEYTQVEDDIGFGVVGGDGRAYAEYVVDIKKAIDRHFRTLPDKAGVLGSSLGGLISFEIGRLYPETFEFVGGMSSTFGWGALGLKNPTLIDEFRELDDWATRNQVFYLDSGGGPPDEGPCGISAGEDNYCETVTLRDVLVEAGVHRFPEDPDGVPLEPADIDIYHWWEPDASHSEAAWGDRVYRPLRLFFRP